MLAGINTPAISSCTQRIARGHYCRKRGTERNRTEDTTRINIRMSFTVGKELKVHRMQDGCQNNIIMGGVTETNLLKLRSAALTHSREVQLYFFFFDCELFGLACAFYSQS